MLDEPQIVSFSCLPVHPNCLALLTQDCTLYHCLFVPRAKAAEQSTNPRGYEDYEEENAGYNSSALLYIYDSVRLDKSTRIECVNFVKGKSF